MSVLASFTAGTSRITSTMCSRATCTAWLSSSGSGGSEWSQASVRRTLPMSTDSFPSGASVPTTNSVEPPPMSTTRYGAGTSFAPRVPWWHRETRARPPRRPRAARARRPGSPPRARRSPRRFVASRAALVAVARTASTPPSVSITFRYARSAANVRSIASGASRRVASTPWPSRVMVILRSSCTSGHLCGG